MSSARISRAVPLEQLEPPETDVRERREEKGVKSLAASMGDPAVGQLQDVLVHPVDHEELADDLDADDLDELHRQGHSMRIVDGETRRLAAQFLGWHSLDATIVPKPPENTVIAQLDANTERLEMSEFATVKALYEHYQQTESTLEDMQQKTGFSPSYLSSVFGLFDAPSFLLDAWRHPEHPLGTSHARAVRQFLSENTSEEYAATGGIELEEARELALEDAQLMVDVQAEHDLSVTEFRKRCSRRLKERKQELSDRRSHEDKIADGHTEQAEQAERSHTPTETPQRVCLVCGDEADRKIAIDVCNSDYGMLSDMQARGELLLEQAEAPDSPPDSPADAAGSDSDLLDALANELGITRDDAGRALHALEQQVEPTPDQ
jgi:ParB-like chromosome segregation protein Spo0J